MSTIRKADLSVELSKRCGLSVTDAAMVLDDLDDIIIENVADGNRVVWTGLVTFDTRTDKPRSGTSFGVPWTTPARKCATVKVGSTLKRAVHD